MIKNESMIRDSLAKFASDGYIGVRNQFIWGGGGGTRALFFSPRPKTVLYFSIGLGVHEILQAIPAKIIDEQKKIKLKKVNLPEFSQSFVRILPFSIFFFFLGGGAMSPHPPPPSPTPNG